jgi:hypothetical protein
LPFEIGANVGEASDTKYSIGTEVKLLGFGGIGLGERSSVPNQVLGSGEEGIGIGVREWVVYRFRDEVVEAMKIWSALLWVVVEIIG